VLEASFLNAITSSPAGLLQYVAAAPESDLSSGEMLGAAQTFFGPFGDCFIAEGSPNPELLEKLGVFKNVLGCSTARAARALKEIAEPLSRVDGEVYRRLVEKTRMGPSGRVILLSGATSQAVEAVREVLKPLAKVVDAEERYWKAVMSQPRRQRAEALARLALQGADKALSKLIFLSKEDAAAAFKIRDLADQFPEMFGRENMICLVALARTYPLMRGAVDSLLERRPETMLSLLIHAARQHGNVWAAERLYQEAVFHLENFQLKHMLMAARLAAENYHAAKSLEHVVMSQWILNLSEKDRSKLLLQMEISAQKNPQADTALGLWFQRAEKIRRRSLSSRDKGH